MNVDWTCRARHARAVAAALAAVLCAPSYVHADSAGAEVLFREGRRLLAEGRTAEACAKLNESQRLDPSSGTLLNLATCHLELGKTATAWAEFLQAERLALAQQRPDRAREAKRRAAQLEPELSRLTIRMAQLVPGVTITRNDDTLAPSALGSPLPVDRGSYRIRVQAPGYALWEDTIQIDQPGEQVVIEVPPLSPAPPEPDPAPQSTPSPAPPPHVDGRPQRARAASSRVFAPVPPAPPSLPAGFWISGGAAVAAASVGSVLGVISLQTYDDARAQSRRGNIDRANELRDKALREANITNAAFTAAAIGAGIAVYLYFSRDTAPRATGGRGAASGSARRSVTPSWLYAAAAD